MPANRNERRYAIGEVAEFALDVPLLTNHYGSFLRGNGQWVQKDQLPERAKSFIRSYNYASGIRLTDLPDLAPFSFGSYSPFTTERPCTANGVTLFNLSNATEVFGYDSSGFFRAWTGASAISGNVYGCCTLGLVSDGTSFYAYYLDNNRQFQVKSSTSGRTWATQTLSGIAPQNSSSSIGSYWNIGNQCDNNTGLCAGQYCYYHGPYLAAWCGARMLLITSDSSNYVRASLSSNRLSFSDATSSILGSSTMTIAEATPSYFYRNGNACLLGYGGVWSYTTDGGASWSQCTGISGAQSGIKFIVNKTNPARLVAIGSGATILFSMNSGATWTAKALPESIPGQNYFAAAYVGDTLLLGVLSNGSTSMTIYKSADNGSTWNPITLPNGVSGSFSINYDGYRWILVSTSQPLLLTSNDASIFLLRTFPYNKQNNPFANCLALDNQTTVISDNNGYVLLTKDAGVTWDIFPTTTKNGGNYALRGSLTLATVQGIQYLLGGCPYAYNAVNYSNYYASTIMKTESLRSRGDFFSWPNINPLRYYAYVRFA